jgi:hypothetical protein
MWDIKCKKKGLNMNFKKFASGALATTNASAKTVAGKYYYSVNRFTGDVILT